MKVKIRTEENILTTTLTGDIAERLISMMLPYTKVGVAKDPSKKVFRMVKDMGFLLVGGVKIMLYKGFLLIVE